VSKQAAAEPIADDLELIPDAEAANILGQKPETLAVWRCKGTGPVYYKVGRRIFYTRPDINAYVVSRRRVPAKKATVK
jgi:hypothetical protein